MEVAYTYTHTYRYVLYIVDVVGGVFVCYANVSRLLLMIYCVPYKRASLTEVNTNNAGDMYVFWLGFYSI